MFRDLPGTLTHVACLLLGIMLKNPFASPDVKLRFSASEIYLPLDNKFLFSQDRNKIELGDLLLWVQLSKNKREPRCRFSVVEQRLVHMSSYIVIQTKKSELYQLLAIIKKFNKHLTLLPLEKANKLKLCRKKPEVIYGT